MWDFAEFFAGSAQVTRALREADYPGVCLDRDYEGKAMDILTDSGMAWLDVVYLSLSLSLSLSLYVPNGSNVV